MALSIDIKPAKEFASSLEYAADALDRVADRESKVNALTRQVGSAAKLAAGEYKKLAAYGERVTKTTKKNADESEKQNKIEKKNREEKGKGLSTIAKYAAAFSAATVAAGALAYKMADIGKEAYDSERSSSALVKAFTMGRDGTKVLGMLDVAAGQLGQTIDETRRKFVDYRSAGFTTADSGALIKTRADLMAVGLTAKEADTELSRVVGAADRMGNTVSKRLLREIQKAYGGIGSGAVAAERALWSVESAQNQVSDAFTRVKADFWAAIAPDIGRAAHRLADFTTELFKSDQGKQFISDLTTAFKDFSALVTAENLMTGLNAIRATMQAIADLAKGVSTVFEIGSALTGGARGDKLAKSFDANADELRKRARELGIDTAQGLSAGIVSKKQELEKSGQFIGDWVTKATATDLEIKSPSKVFARMGRDTVRGFVQGEERELASTEMPMEARPLEAPQLNVNPLQETNNNRSNSVVVNLTVSGNANAEDLAMVIRREFQSLMKNGQLSWGSA